MTGDYFPKPGVLFEERYRMEAVIGSGGFARVYLARDQELDRQVALKILRPVPLGPGTDHDEKTRQFVGRFRREARLVAKLRDPHTITMFDHGQAERGSLYMVTEYIDGRDLKEVVNEEAPLAAERVAQILEHVLSSLQEAHALGILHRDIKPANIMLYEHVGRTDQVKVLDFGIAKSVMADATQTGHDLTAAGTIIGTPRYMAPEQLRGDEMGPMTDLYSLGLVAYELLCAHKANDADSTVNVITRQVTSPSFRLPLDAHVPEGLRSIVDGLLIKDPAKRFQTTDDVLKALADWQDQRRLDPGQVRQGVSSEIDVSENKTVALDDSDISRGQPSPPTSSQNEPSSVELDVGRDTKKLGLVAGALVLAALLAVGAWMAAQPGAADEPEGSDEVAASATRTEFASDELQRQLDAPDADEPQASDEPQDQLDAPGADEPQPPAATDDEEAAGAAAEDDTEEAPADRSSRKVRSPQKTAPQPEPADRSGDRSEPKPEPAAGEDLRPKTARTETSRRDRPANSQPEADDEPETAPQPTSTQPNDKPPKGEADDQKQKRPKFFDVTGGAL
ncbi:MAG: protein kinase domain-containing protein [Persicimonas sp.]